MDIDSSLTCSYFCRLCNTFFFFFFFQFLHNMALKITIKLNSISNNLAGQAH
jgi:hypothetical protein